MEKLYSLFLYVCRVNTEKNENLLYFIDVDAFGVMKAFTKKIHWLEAQLLELWSAVEKNIVREAEDYASRTKFSSTADRNELYSNWINAVWRLFRYIVFGIHLEICATQYSLGFDSHIVKLVLQIRKTHVKEKKKKI